MYSHLPLAAPPFAGRSGRGPLRIAARLVGRLPSRADRYGGDDLGEGVCQSLSVLDQLRLGLRHIEIDITAGYFDIFDPALPEVDKTFVCHSPFPLEPQLVAEIDLKAKEKGIKLGWDPKNLSCEHTNVPLATMLKEIKGWMDANPDEIVMLYYDTKPLTAELPAQVSAMYATASLYHGQHPGSPLSPVHCDRHSPVVNSRRSPVRLLVADSVVGAPPSVPESHRRCTAVTLSWLCADTPGWEQRVLSST